MYGMNNAAVLKGTKKQAGLSLIESIIVLALIGAALTWIVSNQSTANETQKRQMEISNMQAANSVIRQMFGAARNYTGLTNTVMGKSWPNSMMDSTGAVLNRFGGSVTATTSTLGAQFFDLTTTNIPSDTCTPMAAALMNEYNNIKIGATSKPTTGTTAWTVATIRTACAATDPVTIVFTGQ